jgi:hypothetical protein
MHPALKKLDIQNLELELITDFWVPRALNDHLRSHSYDHPFFDGLTQ